MGHAVRSTYLYAGVADLYIEKGEDQLMKNLLSIWDDITHRKMYITGGCGALYDGTSPDGTNYVPDSIQKVHQSFGRPFQLPHSTAHNETCANIGNMLFNWRMLTATADAKYADIVETCLYNSILSGISLDAKRYLYTNPMRLSNDLPYKLRWPKERQEYISCFCCPPNTLRTLCQTQNYAYSVGEKSAERTVFVNIYGANSAKVSIDGIGEVYLTQKTAYPWDGNVKLSIDKIVPLKGKKAKKLDKAQQGVFAFSLRIPAWAEGSTCSVNGSPVDVVSGSYLSVKRKWKAGDVIELNLAMNARLVEANPLVEESRGQVAVVRGPIVYCAESQDLDGTPIDDIVIPVDAVFTPVEIRIDGSSVVALETEVIVRAEKDWHGTLYRNVETSVSKKKIRLIPYYAYGNRGKSEMTVWMPLGLH
jgi:hypothetical protein